MALLYPFSDQFKEDFFPVIVKAFNEQRGTRLDPKEFEILLSVPVKKGDSVGILMVTKRSDDFLRFRVRLTGFTDLTSVGNFVIRHEMNFATSLLEVYWETSITLEKGKFQELGVAMRSALYQRWLNSDHILYLEDRGRLMTEQHAFVLTQT